MPDEQTSLREALQDRYRLDRELGQGGMATVYLAEDLKHHRMVAIKVLRPELAAALGRERFFREITITANLRHPHILPLFDSGEAAGFLYYAMPYVEGESLRARLGRERQIPVDEALRLTREVADALGYAHEAGIVHRDIKPENILLAGGHALVADFGIAQAVGVAGGERLTETGLAIGTPAYMSPEQGMGETELDGRTDLYALGTVLYEMLAGEPPYIGASAQAIVAKRLMEPVPKVSVLRETVPASVEVALLRVLAKSPADRYATAAQFIAAIDQPQLSPGVRLGAPPRRRTLLVLGVLVIAAVAAAIGFRVRAASRPTERPRVAVLPFVNAGLPEDDFFADGLTEEIAARLGLLSGIELMSRSSAQRYRGSEKSVREIGRELGVQYVLTGTIRADRSGTGSGQFRVTPELIRVADEVQVWTGGFTAAMVPGEIFAIQAHIAEQVALAAGAPIQTGEREALARVETEDRAAHQAYLMGRFMLAKGTADGLRQAVASFKEAIARDPKYALAHVGLSEAYAAMPFRPDEFLPDSLAWDSAEASARVALSLDSTLSPAHFALATVLSLGRDDGPGYERELRLAVAFDPGAVAGYTGLAKLFFGEGRGEDALAAADHAVALEPGSADVWGLRGGILMRMGRLDAAERDHRTALLLEPESFIPKVSLAEIAALRGDLGAMAVELGTLGLSELAKAMAAYDAGTGTKNALIEAIARIHSSNPGLDAARQGWLYANIDEPARALTALEHAVALHSAPGARVLRFDSVQKKLADQPRYQALLAGAD